MSMAHTVKCLTLGMPAMFLGGKPRARAGEEGLAFRVLGAATSAGLTLTSEAFAFGDRLLPRFSAEGGNRSPPLSWVGVPAAAKSLVLIAEDPDAPTPKPFVHWMVYGISPLVTGFPEGAANGALEGKNSTMKMGYTGAAPPKGDSPHRYHFQLFALDFDPRLAANLGRRALLDAMQGHVTAAADLVGTYVR
jgi:Raf kinase inhibitor-like YbhB/YbcL family protein